jgi:hypothetical protein
MGTSQSEVVGTYCSSRLGREVGDRGTLAIVAVCFNLVSEGPLQFARNARSELARHVIPHIFDDVSAASTRVGPELSACGSRNSVEEPLDFDDSLVAPKKASRARSNISCAIRFCPLHEELL